MRIGEYLGRKSKVFIIVLGVLLMIMLGITDTLTGYEISFSIFYLAPILLVAWFSGRTSAVFISVASAVTWLIADTITEHRYSNFVIPLWNTIMRLGFFLIISYLVTATKKSLAFEKDLARIDTLTKIENGRGFLEKANLEIDRALRFNHPLTIAYLDIDNFKKVNDAFGHSAGDDLLSTVADTIKENVRTADIVARLGGDEFAIILIEAGEKEAKTAIDKVYKGLTKIVKKNKYPVSFSVGVITYNKMQHEIDDMINNADELMYSVKKHGKNMVKYKVVGKR
ncbi:MAG: hypothetical protein A2536_09370 [Candidatus Firestonebacteria bacterium RIFOXYD2_FULL_39_29]|nr:MAG: hypothetical protein A2536_09370 [Candidatus Firestonebacteria bacterium RIFOXYD2_FULL_39_29]